MILAGPCLITNSEDVDEAIETAEALKVISEDNDIEVKFRVKVWGGGTTPEKWFPGIGDKGVNTLEYINRHILPTGTEVQVPAHIKKCKKLSYLWVGARNSQNYGLLQEFYCFNGDVFIKRGPGMTIDETIGIYDIIKSIIGKEPYIIERGINTFDRKPESRWSPDIKGVLRIKYEREDIFNNILVDCSHSVGVRSLIPDVFKAFSAVGVDNFMFECMKHPEKAKTDKDHMLSVNELFDIMGGWLIAREI